MIRVQLRETFLLYSISLRKEIIQKIQNYPIIQNGLTLPSKPTTSMGHTWVFSPTRKGWLPSLQFGPIQEFGQVQLPLWGLQRDLPAHWHRREQPGPYLSGLHPARTGQEGLGEGLGEGEHSW